MPWVTSAFALFNSVTKTGNESYPKRRASRSIRLAMETLEERLLLDGAISGRKFNDTDGNGNDNGGTEPGLAGWTIQLDAGADDTIDQTTTTGSDGSYSFPNLAPGTYRVR